MKGPLSDLLVIDLSRAVAGPVVVYRDHIGARAAVLSRRQVIVAGDAVLIRV